MDAISLVAAMAASLSFCGIVEQRWHLRHLRSIPIRIHVNGTRGKSGVTRLIAAGLREAGLRTIAKTTGTLPRLILPDGSEEPIYRPGRANVIEQLQIVRRAARERADALVVECMALQPALQSLCELKIIQSTHGVITNARADHLDVMGPTVRDVALSLCGTVPRRGVLYTADDKMTDLFEQAARDRESEVVSLSEDAIATVRRDELERFSYVEHAENVALAVKICADLGVDRSTALRGMWRANPDPGVMTVYQADDEQQSIVFVNGFAANDPESTGKIWEMILERYGRLRRRVAVINCRSDRADRSQQLADACRRWSPADHYVVVGSATELFRHRAIRSGLDARRITSLENAEPDAIVNVVRHQSGQRGLVVGMGNISGAGLELVQYYRRQAVAPTSHQPLYAEAA